MAIIVLIFVFVVLIFVSWQLWKINKTLKDMHVLHKVILKKTIDIDGAHGTVAHRQIMENLYSIYSAIFGMDKGSYKWNGEEFTKSKIRNY